MYTEKKILDSLTSITALLQTLAQKTAELTENYKEYLVDKEQEENIEYCRVCDLEEKVKDLTQTVNYDPFQ